MCWCSLGVGIYDLWHSRTLRNPQMIPGADMVTLYPTKPRCDLLQYTFTPEANYPYNNPNAANDIK